MRRPSLVFALLLLSTTPAHANAACVCVTDVALLPAPGAQGVPRNAKIWVVGGMLGPSRLDGGERAWTGDGKLVADDDARATQQFDPGELAPGRSYRFRGIDFGPATRFTTGSADDSSPPEPPMLRALWIAVREHGIGRPVAELGFDAALDPDTALLHFVLASGRTRLSLITTTTSWRDLGRPECSTPLPFVAGELVSIAVSAIDLAGNESVPVLRSVEVGRAQLTLPGCVRHYHDACLGVNPLALLGGTALTLLAVLGAVSCIAMRLRRVRDVRFAVAEPLSLLVVERVARAVQRKGGVLAAIGIVGVPALVLMDIGPAAIISTIVGCIGLRGFFIARGALQLIEQAASPGQGEPGAGREAREPVTAEVLLRTVIVRRGCEETRLDVSPRALAAARRHAVPTSIAHRR